MAARVAADGAAGAGRADLPRVLLAFTVLPMAWMLSTSIKSQFAAMQYPPQWIPDEPTLEQYMTARSAPRRDGPRVPALLLEQPLGLDRDHRARRPGRGPRRLRLLALPLPGRNLLFFSVLVRNMFPAVVFLIPLFILMRWLGLVNTHGLADPDLPDLRLPLSIWLLKGFYDNIPPARAGGAHRRRHPLPGVPADRHAALRPGSSPPRSTPSSRAWNEYVYACTFLNTQELMTMPVGLQRFFTEYATNWPGLMAASFIMSVPVVVLFLVLQKYFVRALTEGAVKP